MAICLTECFWPDLATAQQQASAEAANTGSTVLRLRGIYGRRGTSLLVGAIPTDALQRTIAGPGRPSIRPRGVGKLHVSRGAAIGSSGEPIGFLVVHHPVELVAGSTQDAEYSSVALEVSLSQQSWFLPFGSICCLECNEPISEARLKAIPGITICMKCQDQKEKK